jgi:tRNA modification GTPase
VEHQSAHRGRGREGAQLTDGGTIAAAATPAGRGGIGVLRVSGPAVPAIAQALLGRVPEARRAQLAHFRDAAGEVLDRGLALYFPAPHSYTGEAMLELHGHGGEVVLHSLLARLLELGARRAQPGEFTQRAYLNGKLDLAQAEAVADLIDAASGAAARAALRSLDGEFSRRVHELVEAVTQLRMFVEAAIDFPEEEIDFLADEALAAQLLEVRRLVAALLRDAGQGRALNEGLCVVIAGAPNAGKSTLLNRLAGHDAAIVTDIPGTTRDLLHERIVLDGLPLWLIDTAGLRATEDRIEAEGIRRAGEAMRKADRVLFLVDAEADPDARTYAAEAARLPAGVPVTLVLNKIDRRRAGRAAEQPAAAGTAAAAAPPPRLALSALTGEGMDALTEHLKQCAGLRGDAGGALSARARHVDALQRAAACIESAAQQLALRRAGELMAEELKRAQQALGEITGEFGSDELLGRIFSSFCIGK